MADSDPRGVLEETARAIRTCTRCRLHVGRTHAVPGDGPFDSDIVMVGEAPGKEEDASGRPFVGAAGKILDKALDASRVPRARRDLEPAKGDGGARRDLGADRRPGGARGDRAGGAPGPTAARGLLLLLL